MFRGKIQIFPRTIVYLAEGYNPDKNLISSSIVAAQDVFETTL
jgi:hypothetical protein